MFGILGKRDPNPYWFNIEIFAVIALNTLKIRQVFSAVFSLYRQKSLMLNCSHLPLRCFLRDFSAAGCRQADACQIRQTERLQKHPSSGNACSSLACLSPYFLFFAARSFAANYYNSKPSLPSAFRSVFQKNYQNIVFMC